MDNKIIYLDLQNNNINPIDFYAKIFYIKDITQATRRWSAKLTKIAFLKYQSPLIW